MNLQKNDIELPKTEEAEETNVPVAKLVKALSFQGDIVGSNLIWDTTNDWEVERYNDGDFCIKSADNQIAGRTISRLSVLKT